MPAPAATAAASSKTAKPSSLYEESVRSVVPKDCVLHPLVLLSVVDHYNRVAKDTTKRVIGILLGQHRQGKANITSSFAVPFEEDPQNPNSWYIDHNYIEDFVVLHRKVTTAEYVIGWYSSDSLIGDRDLDIHEAIRPYCAEPLFLAVNVKEASAGSHQSSHDIQDTSQYNAPAHAYCSIPLSKDDIQSQQLNVERKLDALSGGQASDDAGMGDNIDPEINTEPKALQQQHHRRFIHVNIEVRSDEAEEIGVEHVLRHMQQNKPLIPSTNADGNSSSRSVASMNDILTSKVHALYGFQEKMKGIVMYLNQVIDGKLPYNIAVINRIQDIVSLMPIITVDVLQAALEQHTNDSLLVVYMNSLVRAISALHNIVKNKEVLLAARRDEAVKQALIKSTKPTVNTQDKNASGEEYTVDSVAHDRGDNNK